jgi:hypothetical protein
VEEKNLDPASRRYWSERQGRRSNRFLAAKDIRILFVSLVNEIEAKGMLQEYFGYDCVDAMYEHVSGKLGSEVSKRLILSLGRGDLWPITNESTSDWDDDTLLDVVEYLFDHVSQGIEEPGCYHQYNQCGWHFKNFQIEPARFEYRSLINELLDRMEPGYEIDDVGCIRRAPLSGMKRLLDNASQKLDVRDATDVAEAIEKYLSRGSTKTQRRDAVSQLAGVLENMRADVKAHLSKQDEGALFEIANKFWIRHNKPHERKDYDHEAWWSWLFYFYLDSIVLVTHLRDRDKQDYWVRHNGLST